MIVSRIESSVVRLVIVVLCNLLMAFYIHVKSPCQHLWSINHWTKASYIGVVVLSIYTFLNGQGWLQEDIVRYSWMFVWVGLILVFGFRHFSRIKKVRPEVRGLSVVFKYAFTTTTSS